MRQNSSRLKARNKRIGLVPTMGYLHEGHLGLVRRSVKENDVTVVSIFVNPSQFGPKEDFAKYPRNLKRDEKMLRGENTDILFYPSVNQMYPKTYLTYVNIEGLTDFLCGGARPGHFKGVATVVAKLFNIIKPDTAYFGQKDAQQAAVIKKLVSDLNMDLKIKVLPTAREKDGLALSSRNSYLGAKERSDAKVLYQSLLLAKRMAKGGERSSVKIITAAKKLIGKKETAKIDYVEIVDAKTLQPVKKISREVLVALAVHIGKTRLIDNITLKAR